MQALEYLYYEGTIVIGVHTPRLEPTPATVFLAGTIHSEYLAKVRHALREYRVASQLSSGLQAFLPVQDNLPLYGIRSLRPAGAPRSVDEEFNLEVTSQRFAVSLAMLPSTFTAAPEKAFSIENIVEQAVKDCLNHHSLPFLTIPADHGNPLLAETYIDIMFDLGPATEQGDIEVAP